MKVPTGPGLLLALVLAACTGGEMLAIGAGTALHLWSAEGAPPTVALTPQALVPGQVTWLGHAGFLLRLGGQSVLIDPVLEPGDGGMIRLARRVGQPADLTALDRLDAVLITHDHSDHQHEATLRALAARFPQALLVQPRGARASEARFANQRRLTAGEALTLGGLRIDAVEVAHVGRRVPGHPPGQGSPAAAYALRAPDGRVFAIGDTAASPAFARAGAALGPFDLVLVPIGAGDPEAIMGRFHVSGDEAVDIVTALGARRALPHHWGTYLLTPRSPGATLRGFLAAAAGRIDVAQPAVGGTVAVRTGR